MLRGQPLPLSKGALSACLRLSNCSANPCMPQMGMDRHHSLLRCRPREGASWPCIIIADTSGGVLGRLPTCEPAGKPARRGAGPGRGRDRMSAHGARHGDANAARADVLVNNDLLPLLLLSPPSPPSSRQPLILPPWMRRARTHPSWASAAAPARCASGDPSGWCSPVAAAPPLAATG